MSKINRMTLATLSAAILFTGVSLAEAQTRELRYAEFGPDRGTRAEALKWFDSELRERSDGALGLDITWGGTLLGARNAIDGVSNGVADIASVVPVYEPGMLTAWRVADVRQINDEFVGMMATYELMTDSDLAIADFEAQGVRYVANFTTGPTQLLSKDPVTSLADLEGMTVRATGNFGRAFEANGASATSMSQPDVYQALSTGTIDGTATYAYVINSYKQYEVAQNLTDIGMGQNLGWGIVINQRVWDSLSDDQKAMMSELGRDLTLELAEMMWRSRTDTLANLQAGIDGYQITTHEADPALTEALVASAEEAGMSWLAGARDEGLDADTLLSDFDAAVAKYSAMLEADGYPWADQ